MSCKNPLLFQRIKFTNTLDGMRLKNSKWNVNFKTKVATRYFTNEAYFKFNEYKGAGELIQVPCNKCVGCRLDYARNWANRCFLESLDFDDNYFITLTYNDENMPLGDIGNATLKKQHFNAFIKNVRNVFLNKFGHTGIRYFGCGEYGSSTLRPHYHLIMFNLPLNDLTTNFPTDNGFILKKGVNGFYYYSQLLQDCWPYGYVIIGKCEWQSCNYVARYVLKKSNSGKTDLYALGIEKEFILMSNHPGIGYSYFIKNYKEIYKYDCLVLSKNGKSFTCKPGRYFDKLLQKIDIDFYNKVKSQRDEVAKKTGFTFLKNTSLDVVDYMKNDAENLEAKIKILKDSII